MKEPLQIYGVKTPEIEKNSGLLSELGISTSLGCVGLSFEVYCLLGLVCIGFEECL